MQQVSPQTWPASSMVPIQMPVPQRDSDADKKKVPKNIQTILFIFGVIEILIASVCILCAIVLVCLPYGQYTYYNGIISYVSSGIWCSLFLLVTGFLGIKMKTTNSNCMLLANMTLAIITSIFMAIAVSVATTAALLYGASWNDDMPTQTGLHATIACLSFIGFVLAIIHAALGCCNGICCGGPKPTMRYGYVASSQQVEYLPDGRTVLVIQGASAETASASMQYGYTPPQQAAQNETKAPLPSGGDVSAQTSIPPPYTEAATNQ